MKRFILMFAAVLLYAQFPAHAINPVPVTLPTSVLISSTGISGAAITVTVSSQVATAYSAGLYTYVTHLRIEMYAVSTLTGGATPVKCTTSNIPNNPSFLFPTAAATGTEIVSSLGFDTPVVSTSAVSPVQVICPATSNVIWNVIMGYYQAQ